MLKSRTQCVSYSLSPLPNENYSDVVDGALLRG
jgi:hypothetical protein